MKELDIFISNFFKKLQNIPKNQCPNDPVIFGCDKNAMLANINYEIKYAWIKNLEEAMIKS